MVSTNMIRNVIGIIGNVVSFFLFTSPVPTFCTIWKRRDVEEFSPNPYLASVLNCAMWVFYGMPFVHPHSVLVVTINGFGLFIELVYIAIYLRFANKKQRLYVLKVFAGEVVFFALVVGLTLGLLHTHAKRSLVTGIVCVVFNICMYGMPLDIMWLVIKSKSVKYLPLYLSLANFLNSFIWLTYALLRFDLYLTISNGAGILLGAAQLILYTAYCKSTPKRDNKKITFEAQLSPTATDARIRPSV